MSMQLAERKKLIGFIAEIEASRDRAKGETRHQSDIFKKAKEDGFDNKAMRKVLQRRAMSQVDREKMDEAVDAYEHALGALANAREAIAAGMSAREAAETYHVPRGALGILARGSNGGAENAIIEPDHDPLTGEITTEARHLRDGDAGTPVTSRAGSVAVTYSDEDGTHQEEGEGEKGEEAEASTPGAALPLERVESQATQIQPDGCSTGEDRCLSGRVSGSDEQEAPAVRCELADKARDDDSPCYSTCHARTSRDHECWQDDCPVDHNDAICPLHDVCAKHGRQDGRVGAEVEIGAIAEPETVACSTGEVPREENSSGRGLSGAEHPVSLEVGAVAEGASPQRVATDEIDLTPPPALAEKRREIESRRAAT